MATQLINDMDASDLDAIDLLLKLYGRTRKQILLHAAYFLYMNHVPEVRAGDLLWN